MTYELGIIGAGNMAEAIVRGVLRVGLLRPDQITAADISPARRELFENELGVTTHADNGPVARGSRVLLLSVKPQHAPAALAGIGAVADLQTLFVSIMAGLSSAFIAKHLGGNNPWRVVRTMPNTPMLVGEGMAALCRGEHATADDLAAARKLFEAAADVVEVREDQMDAVTALSGSGPAYFFYFVEHMIAAGVVLGLSPEQARTMAIKTAVGSAKMLAGGADSPQELRRKVTSPGGTTQAAVTHLEQHRAGEILNDAIRAAAARGKELGG